ncbi:MAG: hypothetical protein WCG25_09280 [bacterium]
MLFVVRFFNLSDHICSYIAFISISNASFMFIDKRSNISTKLSKYSLNHFILLILDISSADFDHFNASLIMYIF